MTLPDPHDCPHCGHDIIAQRWNEPVCAMCGAPRSGVEPGCPVRNAMADEVATATAGAKPFRDPVDWTAHPTLHLWHLKRMHTDAPKVLLNRQQNGEPYQQILFWGETWSRAELQRLADMPFDELVARFTTERPRARTIIPRESVTAETARERAVHGGGPRGVE